MKIIDKTVLDVHEPENTNVIWAEPVKKGIDLHIFNDDKWNTVGTGDFDIPISLSDLNDDATHRTVTDTEKQVWNNKQEPISDLSTIRQNASNAYQKPSTGIPLNDFSQDVKDAIGNRIPNYGVCNTAANNNVKEVTINSESFTLETGVQVTIKFTYTNSAMNIATLNVNNTGAKVVSAGNTPVGGANANEDLIRGMVTFVYDGTTWNILTAKDSSSIHPRDSYTATGTITLSQGEDSSISISNAGGSSDDTIIESDMNDFSWLRNSTTDLQSALNNIQPTLTFDSTPTAGSNNPVTSAGIKAYVDNATPTITMDDTPTSGSSNPVKSSGIYNALQGKQDTLTFDTTPTASSTNPVTSGGVKTALDLKANQSTTYTKTEVDGLLEDVAYLGDDDGQATTLPFDPQADTVWNKAQTLGSAQQAQARNNIGAVGSVTVNGTTYTPTNGNVDLGTISGGGGSVTVDSALSITSTNPVQNSVITTALNGKVGSSTITTIVSLTEAAYTALATKDASTLYVILES